MIPASAYDKYPGALASRGSMPKQLVLAVVEVGAGMVTKLGDGPGHLPVPEKAIDLGEYRKRARIADLEWIPTDLDAPVTARGQRIWAVKCRGVSSDGKARASIVTTFDVDQAAGLFAWHEQWSPLIKKLELLESDVVWRPVELTDLPTAQRKLIL